MHTKSAQLFSSWLSVCCLSFLFPLLAHADPPGFDAALMVGSHRPSCDLSLSSKVLSAKSTHASRVRIESSTHVLSFTCVLDVRNLPGFQVGLGIQVAESTHLLGYASDYLEASLAAAGVGNGLSFSWSALLPQEVKLFGSLEAQWTKMVGLNIREVWVNFSDQNRLDFSDFAREHIAVDGDVMNLNGNIGLKLWVGTVSLAPSVSIRMIGLSGRARADAPAQALLRVVGTEALDTINKQSIMFLTGMETRWCAGDKEHCVFAQVSGGMLATDQWVVEGEMGVSVPLF
jgi:hypothetical protein